MGEAKRRKAVKTAAAIPPPDIIYPGDIAGAPLSTSDKAHLARVRQDCRKQSRKALRAAKTRTDAELRMGALMAILTGSGFIFDTQLQDLFQSSRDAQKIQLNIACGMGCYSCCHLLVTATTVEVVAIALMIQAKDPSLVDRVAEVAPQVAGLDSKARLGKRILCPLLKKGLCSIHEFRPLKCRALFSFNAKMCLTAFCGTPEEQTDTKVPVFGFPTIIEPAITQGVRLACADEGLQSCNVEMVGALDLIFSDPTAIDRWLKGEAVFQPYDN